MTNLADPDSFANGVPHEAFARLRAEDPVHWQEDFWSVTKHADVAQVSRDWATFSSERGGTEINDYPPEELAMLRNLPLYMDPPRHTRYRLLVNKAFTPRTVAALTNRIDGAARDIIGTAIGRGECDFVEDVAARLPLRVIADMIGVPEPDRPKLADWTQRIVGWMDPEFAEQRSDATAAAIEMLGYANELAERKRVDGGDDLTTALVHAEIEHDGERATLSEVEVGLFFLLLTIAGYETTRNLVSQAMLAFAEHPDQWRLLRENPALMDTAVEEMLRWGTPTMHFRRTATRDVSLHGKRISEGDKVVVWYVSANRDEEKFADPFRFDITRSPNEHLAFGGGGPHFCFGSHLARIEISALFRHLTAGVPRVVLAGDVRRLRSNFANGLKEMRVDFTKGMAHVE